MKVLNAGNFQVALIAIALYGLEHPWANVVAFGTLSLWIFVLGPQAQYERDFEMSLREFVIRLNESSSKRTRWVVGNLALNAFKGDDREQRLAELKALEPLQMADRFEDLVRKAFGSESISEYEVASMRATLSNWFSEEIDETLLDLHQRSA